jgi:hypothetical protein
MTFLKKVNFQRVKVTTFLPFTFKKGKGNAFDYHGNYLLPYILPFKEDACSMRIVRAMLVL